MLLHSVQIKLIFCEGLNSRSSVYKKKSASKRKILLILIDREKSRIGSLVKGIGNSGALSTIKMSLMNRPLWRHGF